MNRMNPQWWQKILINSQYDLISSKEFELFDLAPGDLKIKRIEKTPGIHFFATREQAENWGNANFGSRAGL